MSEIDRQRIAAVRMLKTLGYTFRDGQWKPPLHASHARAAGRHRSDAATIGSTRKKIETSRR